MELYYLSTPSAVISQKTQLTDLLMDRL